MIDRSVTSMLVALVEGAAVCRPIFTRLFLVVALSLAPAPALAARRAPPTVVSGSLQLFASETGAQAHCPRDKVVWLNTSSGIYHEKGMRWYGRTRHGAYACRGEAEAAGDRDTRNGQ